MSFALCDKNRVYVSFNMFFWTLCFLIFQGCDEYHTSAIGALSSPNYPSPYPEYSNCSYVIDVPNAVSILVTFQNFTMEDK